MLPPPQSPFPAPNFSEYPNQYFPTANRTNLDLQRFRIQAAVRGQMGMPLQSNGFPPLGSRNFGGFSHSLLNMTSVDSSYGSWLPATIRYAQGTNEGGISSQGHGVLGREVSDTGSVSFKPNSNFNGVPSSSGIRRSEGLIKDFEPRNRRRPSYSSVEELRERIASVAKDQHGCRFLQKIVEEGTPREIQFVFSEVTESLCELMVNPFGNSLVQKILEKSNEEMIGEFLLCVVKDEAAFRKICLDTHGTRGIQKLLDCLSTADQIGLMVAALKRITVTLTTNLNGQHVIQHCLKLFSRPNTEPLLLEIAANCVDIAIDKSGCCALQQCVAHARGEARDRLLAQVVSNAVFLSGNPYGNYVVQYAVGMKIPFVTRKIVTKLGGKFARLSMDKYGSNVVEKCLRESDERVSDDIIAEIISTPNVSLLFLDPYANYVVQSALAVSKGWTHKALVKLIEEHQNSLHSHLYGKRVLDCVRGNKRHRL
ncbi:pumilio homolog 12-like [Malania oleifera]|uniref:pumilio homolog 12-like n=1 Tax=Malania oleifera TaxID=397392 RepID=UPI0025AE41DA|nr:pumilio homolog 12-like [Malania oleifera]